MAGDKADQPVMDSGLFYTQGQLATLLVAVCVIDLEDFLRRLDTIESVGRLLNPSGYSQVATGLDAIRRLAEAAREFQKEALRYREATST